MKVHIDMYIQSLYKLMFDHMQFICVYNVMFLYAFFIAVIEGMAFFFFPWVLESQGLMSRGPLYCALFFFP